jgi:hypothetical protein
MQPDLENLLIQGTETIARSARAHAERWGLGSAQSWRLDQRDGRLVWTFPEHTASADAQILGSWNREVGSFAWSWDNDTIVQPLCRTAEQVRAFGREHELSVLTSSPLKVDEAQVRDLVALAFGIAGCTGLYHPFDGRLATYIAFGPVTVERADGATEVVEVPA